MNWQCSPKKRGIKPLRHPFIGPVTSILYFAPRDVTARTEVAQLVASLSTATSTTTIAFTGSRSYRLASSRGEQ